MTAHTLLASDDYIVKRIPCAAKVVCLTFDDGPKASTLPAMLDLLEAEGIKATFFNAGKYMKGQRLLTNRVIAEGHEIGNHTWNHDMGAIREYTYAQMREEMALLQDYFEINFAYKPVLYRAPGLKFTEDARRAMQELSISHAISCSVSTKDWSNNSQDDIEQRILSHAPQAGDIVLMHEGYTNTVAALPAIIAHYKEAGFEFMTISDALALPRAK